MADRHTSIVTGDNLLETYFQRQAIKTLHEKCHLYRLARKFPLPSGSGVSMVFNGWRKISAPSSTLAEASSNAAVNLSSRKVSITIGSYGRSVKITDLAELTSIISPMDGAMKELTQSATLALDNVMQLAIFSNQLTRVGQATLTKTTLLSSWTGALASAFCLNTGTNTNTQFGFPVVFGTSTTRLSADDGGNISSRLGPIGIRKAVYRLRRLAVDPYASGSFVGVCHPNAIGGLFSNPDYKAYIVNYSGGPGETMFKDTVSKVHNVELYSSPNMPRYASSAVSVLPVFISGEGALGVTELGGGVQMIIKRGDHPGAVSEPFNLNSYISYKLRAAAAVLNPSCGVILMAHEGGI